MTTEEVKDYLNRHHTCIHGYICLINALTRQLEYYAPHIREPKIQGYYDAIRDQIDAVRREMEKKCMSVWEWSEMISDESRRKIFIDRYIYCEQWEDIQLKHSYCASSVFEKHRKACREIARKLTEKENSSEMGRSQD